MTISYLETGVLYCEDNLRQLSKFPPDCVDLIYLDPPFFSNRQYEVIWGDEAEVRSFEDRWEGGIQVYINWMQERVLEMHRILKPSGSLYLHCDPHASHYLKIMLDNIFGESHFRNEIIWKRTSSHSSAKKYAPIHDSILYYTKSEERTWNPPRTGYAKEYLDRYYRFDDGDGRLYWRADLCGAGIRRGSSGQPWRGFDPSTKGMHWKFGVETLEELDAKGRIYWPTRGSGWPQYKRYRDELKGKAVSDIWDDIDRINPMGRERRRGGYPTQKPEALLERIIAASSNEGDIVLDPFCGCGTTVTVAERMKRPWLGIDISPTAVELMKRRVKKATNGLCIPKTEGLPVTEAGLRALKHFEFQNWVIQRMHGTGSPRKTHDMGIDGYSFMVHDPIQVKQSSGVDRNVVDNFETAMERAGKNKGYIVAFSFTRGAYEEAARARAKRSLDIELIPVSELLTPTTVEAPTQLFPTPDLEVDPLPVPMPAEAKPSVEELIKSDLAE
jgi:DNA modification methylase